MDNSNEILEILGSIEYWQNMRVALLDLYSPLTVWNECFQVVEHCPEVKRILAEVTNENGR